MADVEVDVFGDKVLAATFDDAARDIKQLRKVNKAAAGIVAAAAKTRAPKRRGRLSRSITTSATNRAGVVKSNVVYAGVQEWGWPARNIQAHHFTTDAAKATEPAWLALYEKHVEDTIEKVRGA